MRFSMFFVAALGLLAASVAASAQVAGYRVGTGNLDLRAIPCKENDGDDLCQPKGEIYLRIRHGNLVEIDTSWLADYSGFLTASDVWRRVQRPFLKRFGPPDSVRIMNHARLPKAYSDGVAAFWTKPDWCGVLTIKTEVKKDQIFAAIDLTIEKQGTWSINCSVYPYLQSSP